VCNVGVNQTVEWIKMSLGTEVGFGPGHIVLDGNPARAPEKKGQSPPQFSANVCCGQAAGWIKMPLGTQVARSVYAVAHPSVCLSSVVCNARAPYLGGCKFRQFFYCVWYFGHPLTCSENFMEIVTGEPLRQGS